MSALKHEKKLLIEKVFEKAKDESLKTAKTSIAKYLEIYFLEDLKFNLSYKSFERYHDFFILEKNLDYPIDKERLDTLSTYLGYKGYLEFLSEYSKAEELKSAFQINGEKETTIFTEVTPNRRKNKMNYYFVLLGIFSLIFFIALNFSNLSNETKLRNSAAVAKIQKDSAPTEILIIPQHIVQTDKSSSDVPESKPSQPQFISQIINKREKECMFWNEDHFEKIFCDEKIPGSLTEGLDDSKFLLKKIKMPDTLTAENALGKVWYDKTNKKVDFFTHHGVHPENGKTLKAVTKHILETYCKK